LVKPIVKTGGEKAVVVGPLGQRMRLRIGLYPKFAFGSPTAQFVLRKRIGEAKSHEIRDSILTPVGQIAREVANWFVRIEISDDHILSFTKAAGSRRYF
jgi:hypothetical protein